MQKKPMSHFMTGVAVPVFSLRSPQSCGVGEFADLVDLGRWCARVGIEIIQILPVNDTGADSSPYSLTSAFALHPLYLRLEAIEGASDFREQIEAFRACHNLASRVDYPTVLAFKTSMLQAIYGRYQRAICADEDLLRWIRHNPWVRSYAVFCVLQQTYGQQSWQAWPDWQNPTASEIESFFDTHADETTFYAWVQWQLEQQLHAAAVALDGMAISLKGDLPVLINRESADVWAQRPYFDLSVTAGAPPDMFSPLGQNWCFPVYAWEAHRQDNFRWWRARLAQAGKFFHAFRIDHVLGFFRIWQIPLDELSGLMGHFAPARLITVDDLSSRFDSGRIRWLSVPHIPRRELQQALSNDAERVWTCYLDQLPGEELFQIKPELDNERTLAALPEPETIRDFLTARHRDRVLIPVTTTAFAPAWYFFESPAFATLSGAGQELIRALVERYHHASETVWEAQGRELLGMIAQATDMLICAEDLGTVPACVPQVLASLDILCLRIERWTRKYTEPGAPYIDVAQYPRLSVCTPSVHDTSPLRHWWREPECDKAVYARLLDLDGAPPAELTPELCRRIIERQLTANSILCIFQIQDLFALTTDLRSPDPKDERINVPGTVDPANWSYRMPVTLDHLTQHETLNSLLAALIAVRRQRRLSPSHTFHAKPAC
jgi:4-alpha-glucanotransferase